MNSSIEELEWAEMGGNVVHLFQEDLEMWEGKRVLEIGAGRALIGHACKQWGIDCLSVDRGTWDGIEDWDRDAVAEMQSLVPFLQADAANLPLTDDAFDIVISDEGPPAVGTRTLREIRAILSEVRRVLRPGGLFLLHPSGLVTKYAVPLRMSEEMKIRAIEADPSRWQRIREKSAKLMGALLPGMQIIEDQETGFDHLRWQKLGTSERARASGDTTSSPTKLV